MKITTNDAVQMQIELAQWYRTDDALAHYEYMYRAVVEAKIGEGHPPDFYLDDVRDELNKLSDRVRTAELFLVNGNMTGLCLAAGETIPPIKSFHPDDFPARNGIIIWSGQSIGNIVGVSDSGTPHQMESKTIAYHWDCDYDPRGLVLNVIHDGDFYRKELNPDDPVWMPRLLPLAWLTTDEYGQFTEKQGSAQSLRVFLATLRLMEQTIVTTTTERAPRGTARRAARHNVKSDIRVVQLRRQHTPTGQASENQIEREYQWLVRGHWRNQWFPARQVHRPVWIAPYVKGPEDKPLKITKKVTVLGR